MFIILLRRFLETVASVIMMMMTTIADVDHHASIPWPVRRTLRYAIRMIVGVPSGCGADIYEWLGEAELNIWPRKVVMVRLCECIQTSEMLVKRLKKDVFRSSISRIEIDSITCSWFFLTCQSIGKEVVRS